MNIAQAWEFGRRQLADSDSPELDARLLLQHLLRADHSYLVGHGERALTDAQEGRYRQMVARAQRQEPIPYLTGAAWFGGLEFEVNPSVLIPRPETEQLLALALARVQDAPAGRVADAGTGSGCLAVCLARGLPEAQVWASDISPAALAVAGRNVERHAPGRVRLVRGDLLQPFPGRFDVIVANLPYVADGEWTEVDEGVKLYEPAVALEGGPDGLRLVERLLSQATSKLNSGGALFLEIGWRQGETAQALARSYFALPRIGVLSDFAGRDRVLTVETGRDARPA